MKTKDLIGHLRTEIELFKELIAVLHAETECMVGRDYKGLYEAVSGKEQLVTRINSASETRRRLLRECLESIGADMPVEANLTALVELTGNGALVDCQKTLLSLASTVKEINGVNRLIMESSMENVTRTLGFLGNFMQPGAYKSTGSFGEPALKGMRLSEGA